MNQNQLAELFATSAPNISMHISNVLKDGELEQDSVVKDYFTTAAEGKEYKVTFIHWIWFWQLVSGFEVSVAPSSELKNNLSLLTELSI